MALPFKDAFADAFGCRPQDFTREALQRCLYPHARFLWGFLELSGGPPVLAAEAFMALVAQTRNKGDLLDAIAEYQDGVRPHSGFLARRLYLRVSVERLLALHHFVREVEHQHTLKETLGRPADVILI
jgi:hypothetical protein